MKITTPLLALLLASPLCARTHAVNGVLPEDPRKMRISTSYHQMDLFLQSVNGKGPVTVSVAGTSRQGRSVFAVHLKRGNHPAPWRILLFAQQHGDETSGKDALLYMIRDIVRLPDRLPADVDLWMVPAVNPDGGEAARRRNGNNADLNRDHMTLLEPESLALHRLCQRFRPHVTVDCHEFDRGRSGLFEKGWLCDCIITMDGMNNPLFDDGMRHVARRWVDEMANYQTALGHHFMRYWVGGLPPDEEQRHSCPDVDSAVNALGMYGAYAFIAEAGIVGSAQHPDADMGERVEAYESLLWRFVHGNGRREEERRILEAAGQKPLPAFIPTNFLWVNPDVHVTDFPLVERVTGRAFTVPTANMMTEVAVKTSVPRPRGYAIHANAAGTYAALFDRLAIPYERISTPRVENCERCQLLRVENGPDELYSRYEGRQVVKRDPPSLRTLGAGWLYVPVRGEAARRIILILEPAMVFGLYQYPLFRGLVATDGTCPVWRVVGAPTR
jgi:hypothetical protein